MSSFRTKRGRCIIDEERLYLSSSLTGLLKRWWEAGIFGKIMVSIYPGLILILATNFFLLDGDTFLTGIKWGAALAFGGIALIHFLNYFRGFSRRSVIPVDSIKKVKKIEGEKGFTRPRFILEFEQNGKIKKRYVMMPSKILNYAEAELEKAEKIFREKGLEVVES